MKHPVEYWRSSGLISPQKLEDALRRQVIYGGSFDTVLLELELIDAAVLCEHLNAALGFDPIANHWIASACQDLDLPSVEEITSHIIDGWVAPLRLETDQLWLALHPESSEQQHQFVRSLCPEAKLAAIPECCLVKLVSRCGGPPPSNRHAGLCYSILRQLSQNRIENSSPYSGATESNPLFPINTLSEEDSSSVHHQKIGESSLATSNSHSENSFDPAPIRRELESATDRASLIRALLEGTRYFSDRIAVFAVRSDGLYSTPDKPQLEGVDGAIIPLSNELKRAISGERYIEYTRDLDLRLAVGLENIVPCILAPIAVNQKTIFMLYADRNGGSFSDDEVRIVHELCGWAGITLWEIIKSNRIRSPTTTSPKRADYTTPSPTGTPTLHSTIARPEPDHSPPRVPTEILSARIQPGPPPILPQVVALQHQQNDDSKQPATTSYLPSKTTEVHRTDIIDLPVYFSKQNVAIADCLQIPIGPEEFADSPRDAAVSKVSDDDHELTSSLANRIEPNSAEYNQLRQAFFDALSDPSLVPNLLQFGDDALNMIAAEFPGTIDLLRYDRESPPPPSAHGPLMRLVLEVGTMICPHILPLLERGDEKQRFYTAFVFQEFRDDRCMPSLGSSAFDSSHDVRTIAMRVLETYRHRPQYDQVIDHIRQELSSNNISRVGRCTRAMGILRDIESIPRLIHLLGNKNRQLQEAALEALVSITGQQLGLRKGRWRGWYADNNDRSRIEWLIQALDHHDASVYGWASDELQRITGHTIQTHHSPTKEQRYAAIEQWNEWWRNAHEKAMEKGP